MKQDVILEIAPEFADTEKAKRLTEKFSTSADSDSAIILRLDADGLSMLSDGQVLKGDFTKMLPRLMPARLRGELLLRAAKQKDNTSRIAVDATAGLGEDSLLLAAAGFEVILFERNPVIYELLCDALERAERVDELKTVVSRMKLYNEDSIQAMRNLEIEPDVILLDPMFPQRQKNSLVKKKLQIIQRMEAPCDEELELLRSAISLKPKKLIIKRAPKSPYLAGIKAEYSISGKAVRYDCFVNPFERNVIS